MKTLRCGICNEVVELPSNIVDGQHIKCPYCGAKTVYSAPVRIQLPDGYEAMERHSGKHKHHEQDPIPEKTRPTFRVIRNGHNETSEDLNAASLKRHFDEVEQEQNEEARRDAEVRRQVRRRDLVKWVISIILAIGVIVGGVIWYQDWSAKRKAEHEAWQREWMRRQEENRLEEERVKREREQKKQEYAEKLRKDEERRRLEREKLEAEQKAKAAHEELVRNWSSKFSQVRNRLYDCKIDYWHNAPPKEKKAKEVEHCYYYCCLYDKEAQCKIVLMEFKPGEETQYLLLKPDDLPSKITADEYAMITKGRAHMIFRTVNDTIDATGYISFSSKKLDGRFRLPKEGESINPTLLEIGKLYDLLGPRDDRTLPKFSYMAFYHPQGDERGLPICEIQYGDNLSWFEIYRFAEGRIRDHKSREQAAKVKHRVPRKVRRTGFANYSTISRTAIDGTYTPGEYHGTRVYYGSWRSRDFYWIPSHYVSRGYYDRYFRCKRYTHWKDRLYQNIQASGEDDNFFNEASDVDVSDAEVRAELVKASLSFKVVE